MDMEIGRIAKGKTADVRIRFSEYKGRQYVDFRQFVVSDATGDRVPTKKGLTLPPAKLPELRDLVDKAVAKAREAGLLDASDSDQEAA